MTFNNTLKLHVAMYGSTLGTRGRVLKQLFATNGNGMWWDHGELVGRSVVDGVHDYQLVRWIDSCVYAGFHKASADKGGPEITIQAPLQVARAFGRMVIGKDFEERLSDVSLGLRVTLEPGYNLLEAVPADVKSDWLNAAWEAANLFLTPVRATEEELQLAPVFKMSSVTYRDYLAEQCLQTIDVAAKALEKMQKEHPGHIFEVNPAPYR